jgi:hypothetical protein
LTLLAFTSAKAATVTVNSTDDIYNAGTSTPPNPIAIGSGATAVTFTSVTGSLTTSGGNGCASPLGCIVLNNGTGNNPNDPDGVGAAPGTSSNTGANGISGITGPGAGYLVGVFLAAGGPSGATPVALDFTSAGLGTSFSSLSPLLDQTFFIGDGLTGDGTGSLQTFNIPSGAADLYLGISDAGGYNGSPGAYDDNLGSYSVTSNLAGGAPPVVTGTPEPGSLGLIGTALLGIGCLISRSRARTRK